MGIPADVDPLRWLLAAILLAAQFGCASVNQQVKPAAVTEKSAAAIEQPKERNISQCVLEKKISEVKGKTLRFCANHDSATALTLQADSIWAGQLRDIGVQQKRMTSSCMAGFGLGAALSVVILFSNGGSGGAEGWGGGIVNALLAVGSITVGTVGGCIYGIVSAGPVVNEQRAKEIEQLICRYNANISLKAMQPPGSHGDD